MTSLLVLALLAGCGRGERQRWLDEQVVRATPTDADREGRPTLRIYLYEGIPDAPAAEAVARTLQQEFGERILVLVQDAQSARGRSQVDAFGLEDYGVVIQDRSGTVAYRERVHPTDPAPLRAALDLLLDD